MASLGSALVRRWGAIQSMEPGLESPFFRPEFSRAVNEVHSPVEVVVGFDGMNPVAFFPFQRRGQRVGAPVGGRLSDYHGVVASAAVRRQLPVYDLLKAAGLDGWDFHHAPLDQSALAPNQRDARGSWTIDLGGGYSAYVDAKGREGTRLFERLRYCERRMARELGPITFTLEDAGDEALGALFHWKSRQYRDAVHPDQFEKPENCALIARLRHIRQSKFAGVLSTLRAGSELVAVHFGIRTDRRLHYWFPAYARSHSAFSPGLLLLRRLCEAVPSEGLDCIDLGAGDDSYKLRFATGSVPVVAGSVNAPTAMGLARSLGQSGWSALRNSPLALPALRARDGWRGWNYARRPLEAADPLSFSSAQP